MTIWRFRPKFNININILELKILKSYLSTKWVHFFPLSEPLHNTICFDVPRLINWDKEFMNKHDLFFDFLKTFWILGEWIHNTVPISDKSNNDD